MEKHYREEGGQEVQMEFAPQPSVNMEIVPAQQPARVVRKAHVFDEVADVWRETLGSVDAC